MYMFNGNHLRIHYILSIFNNLQCVDSIFNEIQLKVLYDSIVGINSIVLEHLE